ncbi:MAG: hypothetical protein ABSH31_16000 [Bryobacteraceae bacterium]|jgi:hypothetical protein
MADERSALLDLIRRGRRRQVAHLAIHAASFAAAVALAGVIVLLIVGAQILNWYWLAAVFAFSLAAGAYHLRSRLLTPYQIAQSLDRRLELKDALSTAYYFGNAGHPATRRDFMESQRDQAESLARSADIDRGMPLLLPRSAYINLALVALAVGMFGLRYGIKRSLDLGSPLVHVNLEGFFGNSPKIADARARGKRAGDGDGPRDPAAENAWDSKPGDLDPATDAARESVQDPAPNNGNTSPDGPAKADAKSNQQLQPGSNPLDAGEKGESPPASDPGENASAGSDSKSGQQDGSKDAKDAKEGNQSGNSENSSLASKLRDALSNLLAKMKPQSKQGGGKPNDSSQSASSRPPQPGEKQEGDSKSASKDQADASANSQSEGEQQQGGAQQAAQGKSEGPSNSQPNSPDGKSGIGKQDGDKAAREAAELAAMGKLSEIIGKRAANITGEVMVEVASGKQQLKTQYSDAKGAHTEAGGEINRDEVPLAYQQYVQQYFAQMRKLPAGKNKAAPDSKPKTTSLP